MKSYQLSAISYQLFLLPSSLAGKGGLRRRAVWLSLLLLLVLAVPALAQAPAPAPRPMHPDSEVAREAIGELRSPYCPGLMLEVCPSGQAEMLRDSIRMLAQEGRSADWIVERMIANHGEEWRAIPKRSGAGLWAWILPPLALLLGVGVVAAKLHSLRSREDKVVPGTGEMSEADRDRLAAALREWEHAEETGE